MSKAAELAALIGSQTALSNRNLIINGAMQVAQRGTSSTSTGYKTTDRFWFGLNNFDNAAFTQAQSTIAPAGFSNSWRIDCTTAETALAADEYSNFLQIIEAQNLQHIQNGSTAAKSLTLSFYVKSNKTGTYSIALYKIDNTARQITATYAISAADTWEYKTITFAGDTAGGGITDDNGAGLYVYWHLAAGTNFTSSDSTSWSNYSDAGFAYGHAVNIFDSTANDWAITGIQLEVGEQATAFEHRSFGDELLKCYRYCYVWKSEQSYDVFADLNVWSSSALLGQYALPVDMNHDPAIEFSAVGDFVFSATNADRNITALALNRSTPRNVQVFATDSDHGFSAGVGGFLRDDGNNNATVTLEAEL
tara:strand:- start:229 stop:1320 length:1092 start_codon:yes stop_codon:yes gene_type:complete